MCIGIRYSMVGERVQVVFGPSSSKVPVRLRNGNVAFHEWGDDGKNDIKQPQLGPMKMWPQASCAQLEAIRRGEWGHLRPRPCKVMATGFALMDVYRITRWFDVPTGMCIQGLFASSWSQHKVYLVTVPANESQAHIADRWMRFVPCQ